MSYEDDFKRLWVKMQFVEARDLYHEWFNKGGQSDINCAYAGIIIHAAEGSIPYSTLKGAFDNLNSQSSSSRLTGWYKAQAKIFLDRHPNR